MIKKILGMIGAALFSVCGLVLAGKSGFGETWFSKKNDKHDPDEFEDDDNDIVLAEEEDEVMVEDLTDEES